MRTRIGVLTLVMLFLAAGVPLFADDPMIFNRDLPVANLNDAAGADRSNVAWAFVQPWSDSGHDWYYATGDDFSLGAVGETFNITKLRVWLLGTDDLALSDVYDYLMLYGGGTTLASVNTIATVATTGDPNVSFTQVTYAGGAGYQGNSHNFITSFWQVDFLNLNWIVSGGHTHTFFVDATPDEQNLGAGAFNHASNAALSGNTPQDGADDSMWYLGRYDGVLHDIGQWTSYQNGWDKASDIDVQIYGSQVPEPGAIILFGTVLAILTTTGGRKLFRR